MAQNGTDKKIERSIEALLTCGTVTEAAKQAKISRRTLCRWLHEDPDFQQRLRGARQEAWAHGSARICRLLGKAIDVIKGSLDGRKVAKHRFLSARLVIESCQSIQENDLGDRVDELERRVRERQNPYGRELENLSIEQLQQRFAKLQSEALEECSVDDLRQELRKRIAQGTGSDSENPDG